MVAAACAALVAGAIALRAPARTSPRPGVTASSLPAPRVPAFTPGRPQALGALHDLSSWAPVRRRALARRAPDRRSAVAGVVPRRTPEGTDDIVAVLARRQDRAGRTWVRVRLAALPNGRTGWVPRRALAGYQATDLRLDVDLGRLAATLYRAGRPVFRARVGVGMAGWPTPRGTFLIRNRLTRYRSPTYGPVAFGTTARSPRATDWPAGGFVGIHGTDRPELIPGRVSHGCIRMRNADVAALARLMPPGTPLTVH